MISACLVFDTNCSVNRCDFSDKQTAGNCVSALDPGIKRALHRSVGEPLGKTRGIPFSCRVKHSENMFVYFRIW